jgi:hypothetical protein
MKSFCFTIVMLLSVSASGQKCDPNFMFERIVWPEASFTLLKQYAIPVHAIKDVPFSVQYSYLLEKGNVYGFYFKPIGKSIPAINFTITNSDNQRMSVDTLENFREDGVLLSFFPSNSDAYNLNLHSPKSFEGCVVFHVSVHRPEVKRTKEGWKVSIPTASKASASRKRVEKDSVVKKFELRYNSSSRHAIELVEGQLYALQIPDDQSAKILNVHVGSGHTDASINTHIVPQEKGYILYIRSSESGVHTFDFLNQSEDKSAVAILMMTKERSGLPK